MLVSLAAANLSLDHQSHVQLRPVTCAGKSCLLDRWTNGVFESHPKVHFACHTSLPVMQVLHVRLLSMQNTIGAAFAAKKVGPKSAMLRALIIASTS